MQHRCNYGPQVTSTLTVGPDPTSRVSAMQQTLDALKPHQQDPAVAAIVALVEKDLARLLGGR